MMNRKIGILVGVLALVASSAFAGSRPSWIAINGGAAFPSSDLSDVSGTGWLAGASYGLSLNEKFAIGADVNYYGFGKKTVQTVDVQPKTWQYTASGYYMMSSKGGNTPYAKVGLGAYSVNPDVSTVSSKTLFGWNAGLGYNKAMSNKKTSFGLDATYHWLSQNDEFVKPSNPTEKASYSFFSVAAHVGWGLGGM
jgi:hypothetical protein